MTDHDPRRTIVARMIKGNSWRPTNDAFIRYFQLDAFIFKMKVTSIGTNWIASLTDWNGGKYALQREITSEEEAKCIAVDMLTNHIVLGNGALLSPWTTHEGYCAMRFLAGTNPDVVANRIAFIEKTPRVRIAPEGLRVPAKDDYLNWWQGPKGSGGGDPEADKTYGFDPESRAWCDEQLITLGYVLS